MRKPSDALQSSTSVLPRKASDPSTRYGKTVRIDHILRVAGSWTRIALFLQHLGLVHKGERILPRSMSSDGRGLGGGSQFVFAPTIHALDAQGVDRVSY